jgi:hypothetical protein
MKTSLLVIENQLSCYCGPKDGGNYDLSNACPVCGTGARRVDSISLPAARLKDRVSNTLKFEVVIPPRLAGAIKSVAPRCLRNIRDEKTGELTPFFQLIPEITLPRWSAATTGWCTSEMVPPCSTCKRDGYFNVTKAPLRLSYRETLSLFSVAETYEHFGKSRLQPDFKESNFAVPLLVVSQALEDALAGEPGVTFVPVGSKRS